MSINVAHYLETPCVSLKTMAPFFRYPIIKVLQFFCNLTFIYVVPIYIYGYNINEMESHVNLMFYKIKLVKHENHFLFYNIKSVIFISNMECLT